MTEAQLDFLNAYVARLNEHHYLAEKFAPGNRVRKIKGASWQGRIVGMGPIYVLDPDREGV